MNWSGPNCNFLQIWITFEPDQFILVVTISFWSWPNHYGQVQINLVRPKPFWTDQNWFGHIEGQGISLSLIVFLNEWSISLHQCFQSFNSCFKNCFSSQNCWTTTCNFIRNHFNGSSASFNWFKPAISGSVRVDCTSLQTLSKCVGLINSIGLSLVSLEE